MRTTTLKTPAHFATIDTADLERELIGLIWDKHPALTGVSLRITGVRSALTYHGPNAAWPTVKRSRELRQAGAIVTVRYERA